MSNLAKLPSNRVSDSGVDVVVDKKDYENGRVFDFHDPRNLDSLIDMVEIPEEEARELGGVGCSSCFRELNGANYEFQWLAGGVP